MAGCARKRARKSGGYGKMTPFLAICHRAGNEMDSDELRPVRQYVAWILVVAAGVLVGVAAWQFLGLPEPSSGSLSAIEGPSPGVSSSIYHSTLVFYGLTLAERGQIAIAGLVSVDVTVLPVGAVLLAAARPRVPAARGLVLTAVIIQAVALVLAIIGWGAALTTFGQWGSLTTAADLVVAGAGLILTTAVLRSPALRDEA
jgi:Kef-type K+ transport system membrane component KefB